MPNIYIYKWYLGWYLPSCFSETSLYSLQKKFTLCFLLLTVSNWGQLWAHNTSYLKPNEKKNIFRLLNHYKTLFHTVTKNTNFASKVIHKKKTWITIFRINDEKLLFKNKTFQILLAMEHPVEIVNWLYLESRCINKNKNIYNYTRLDDIHNTVCQYQLMIIKELM